MIKHFAAAAVIVALALLASCGKDKPDNAKDNVSADDTQRSFRVEDFADKRFAILNGSSFDKVARETIGARQRKYYDTPAKAVEAVINGEADATLIEEPVGRKYKAQNPELLTVLYPPVDIENYAPIFSKKNNGELRGEFNKFLVQIRSDSTYDDMVSRWVDSPESPPMPEIPLSPSKRKLVFATSDCDEPFSFKTPDGKLTGFEVELALRFAQAYGYDLDIRVMEFPEIIPSVQAGLVDFASNLITITDERMTLVDFSEPIYYGGTVVLTRN